MKYSFDPMKAVERTQHQVSGAAPASKSCQFWMGDGEWFYGAGGD